jgi:hypothetical protein
VRSQPGGAGDQSGRGEEGFIRGGGRLAGAAEDRRRRLDRKATGKPAEPTERALFNAVEQLITPCDRRVHRSLTFRQVPGADGRQQHAVLEPGQQVVG